MPDGVSSAGSLPAHNWFSPPARQIKSLIDAVENGSASDVRKWLEKSDDVNQENEYGNSALIQAVWRDDPEILQLLLNCPELDVNKRDEHGNSPLSLAIRQKKRHAAKQLIACPRTKINDPEDVGGRASPCIFELVEANDVELLREMLARRDVDLNTKNYCDRSPLEVALEGYRERNEAAALLIDDLRTDVNVRNGAPIRTFIEREKISLLTRLLKRTDLEVNIPTEHGNTPLHNAIDHYSDEAAILLIGDSRVDCNFQNSRQATPFGAAMLRKNKVIIEKLLQRPDVDPYKDDHFEISLLDAARSYPEIAIVLINDRRVNVRGLLHEAQDVAVVQALLKHPDLDVNEKNHVGWTPLMGAIRENKMEKFELLLDDRRTDVYEGSPFKRCLLEIQHDPDFANAFAAHPRLDVGRAVADLMKESWLILSDYTPLVTLVNREDFDVQVHGGDKLFERACKRGNVDLIVALIRKGANWRDDSGAIKEAIRPMLHDPAIASAIKKRIYDEKVRDVLTGMQFVSHREYGPTIQTGDGVVNKTALTNLPVRVSFMQALLADDLVVDHVDDEGRIHLVLPKEDAKDE